MIRVLIVDDHKEVAHLLKDNLSQLKDIKVIGIGHGGEEAVAMTRLLKPDVVVMDINMPGMDGMTACKKIKEQNHQAKVLMLTLFDTEPYVLSSILNGADGYLCKGESSQMLGQGIIDLYQGVAVYDKGVNRIIKKQLMRSSERELEKQALEDLLTQQEISFIRLVTNGLSDREIALKLGYSEGYIRNKLSQIRKRLDLKNSRELAVWGAKNGLF